MRVRERERKRRGVREGEREWDGGRRNTENVFQVSNLSLVVLYM